MKKVEYSRLSQGGPGGASGSSDALPTSRGSSPIRSRGSHPSPGGIWFGHVIEISWDEERSHESALI
jgi:hypothetical protein